MNLSNSSARRTLASSEIVSSSIMSIGFSSSAFSSSSFFSSSITSGDFSPFVANVRIAPWVTFPPASIAKG